MKLMAEGMEALRDIARQMRPESLHSAARHFKTLVENNTMLAEGWPTAVRLRDEEHTDPRIYISRIVKHAAEVMCRDMGTVLMKEIPAPSGHEGARAYMIEIAMDKRPDGSGIPDMLLRKIVNNNMEMLFALSKALLDTNSPAAFAHVILETIPPAEFQETGEMLQQQLALLTETAAERGHPLDLAPVPLAAWLPPKGAAGH